MKKYIKQIVLAALALPVMAFGVVGLTSVPAFAAGNCTDTGNGQGLTLQNGADCSKGTGQQEQLFGQQGVFKTITDVMLFLIGAISVIMLIIGGIRYVISGGESSAVQSAKNTILYAIVGVVVAILAYAVVNFVIGNFSVQS